MRIRAQWRIALTRAIGAVALGLSSAACGPESQVIKESGGGAESGPKNDNEGEAVGGDAVAKACSSPAPKGAEYPKDVPCSTDADCPASPHPCMQAYCGLFYCAEGYAGDGQPDVCGPGLWCEEQTPDDLTPDVACCDEPPRCISLYVLPLTVAAGQEIARRSSAQILQRIARARPNEQKGAKGRQEA